MISFKILPEREDVKGYLDDVKDCFSSADALEEIRDLLEGYYDLEGDDGHAEVAVSVSSGCFLIRVCQYEYAFLCPIPISEGASISAAADEIRKYAIKEELYLVFIDVYADDVSEVSEPFRFVKAHPMDESGEVFAVVPETEAAQIGGLPVVEGERVVLNSIGEDDISDFARLCRHREVNKLYGNDYRDVYGDAPDGSFLFRTKFEEQAGISMPFAIRYEGKFAGEAVIFDFDYVGGAKVAIRLLPEFWGKGIGSETLELLVEVAKEIDLKRISTSVKKENTSSIAMTKKYMNYKCDEGDTAIFEVEF
jgi:RimJ/RimL family protein N-acetyltransferase